MTADRRLDPSPLTVAVILGSIRKGRLSERPARLIAERIAAAGHMVRFVDLHALPLPIYDEEEATEQHPNVLAFKELLSGIDASVWLSPEYNFSITAALKNAIEHAPKLTRTPAALCSLSSGQFGGSRALEHLKLIMPDLGAVPIPRIVRFGEAKKLFDGDTLLRPEILQRIDAMLDELFWYAQVLRWGRENLADGA